MPTPLLPRFRAASIAAALAFISSCAGKTGTPPAPSAAQPPGADAAALVYVSGSDSPEIRVLRFDRQNGQLTPLATVPAAPGSGYLAFHPGKKFLYGINRNPAKVVAYAINPDGGLTRINDVTVTGPTGPTHVAVHPDGKWVMVAYFGSGHVTIHPIKDDGGVGEPSDLQPTPREAHHAMTAGGGKYLVVPCRDGNAINQYAFDEATGKLTLLGQTTAETGAGPRHIAFHPTRDFAYAINELNGTMTSYRFDPQTGRLSDPQSLSTVPPGTSEVAAAHVEVHPNGRFVYGSNRRSNSIALFAVEDSGRLQPLGHENAGGLVQAPRDFTLDPSGKWMLVANQGGATVVVFAIGEDGRLRQQSQIAVQSRPTFVGLLLR